MSSTEIAALHKKYDGRLRALGRELHIWQKQYEPSELPWVLEGVFSGMTPAVVSGGSDIFWPVDNHLCGDFVNDLTDDYVNPRPKYRHDAPYDPREGLDQDSLTVYLFQGSAFDWDFLRSLCADKDAAPSCDKARVLAARLDDISLAAYGMTGTEQDREKLAGLLEAARAVVGPGHIPGRLWKREVEDFFDEMLHVSSSSGCDEHWQACPLARGEDRDVPLARILESGIPAGEGSMADFISVLDEARRSVRVFIEAHDRSFGGLGWYIQDMREDFKEKYGSASAVASVGLRFQDDMSVRRCDVADADCVLVLHANAAFPDLSSVTEKDMEEAAEKFENAVFRAVMVLNGDVFCYSIDRADGEDTGGEMGPDYLATDFDAMERDLEETVRDLETPAVSAGPGM